MNFIKKVIGSIKYALHGVKISFRERNFRIHIFATLCVAVVAWLLKLSVLELMILVLLINNVLTAEMFNTSLEEMVENDKKLGLPYEKAGDAKDIAAGAVLINAITAVIVGVMIIWPYISDLIK